MVAIQEAVQGGGDEARRRELVGNPRWAAFSAGQLINQLTWHLTQYMALDEGGRQDLGRLITELVPPILAITPIDIGISMRSRLAVLKGDLGCAFSGESIQDDCLDCYEKYKKKALGEVVDDAFYDMVEAAIRFGARAREIVYEAIDGRDELKECFFLGEVVDQGIRPPIEGTAVYRMALNREHFRHKRSDIHLADSVQSRKEWGRYYKAVGVKSRIANEAEDEDDDYDDTESPVTLRVPPPARPRRPRLPFREHLVMQQVSAGELPPATGWHGEVEALWRKLSLPEGLPGVLFAHSRRRLGRVMLGVHRALVRFAEEAYVGHAIGQQEGLRSSGSPNSGAPIETPGRAAGFVSPGGAGSADGSTGGKNLGWQSRLDRRMAIG